MAKSGSCYARYGSDSAVNRLIYALLFIGIAVVDRISKWLIIHFGIAYCKVTSWLSWCLHYNRGVSWSFLHAEDTGLFVLVSLLVAFITGVVAWHAYTRWCQGRAVYGQMMVIAGSCSNLLDRVLFGGVVDFIHLHVNGWSFAVFNIADAAIVLGVLVMFLQEVYHQDA